MATYSAQVLFEFDKVAMRNSYRKEPEIISNFRSMLEELEALYYENIGLEVPVNEGDLWASTTTVWEAWGFEISPTADHAKYVIKGHESLATEAQRRWWFWYLNEVLGGDYERKTDGPPGYVPPNDYMQRAIDRSEGEFANIFESFMSWLGMDTG